MLETGSTGFMLLATSLVMLMTPGLAFFYGGLASKRNILGIMIQSFVSLGWTTVLWIMFGYSLCFSGGEGGIIGNFDKAFLMGITPDMLWSGNGKIPEYLFIAYQMMFAIITPALITGAFVNRVTFKSYLIFLTFWQILVYYPFVHMIWGGGILAEWGVLDFAGGIVVHATAGFAALASVFFVGPRTDKNSTPNSIPLVAIGSGLLWFGWYGFNAGSEVAVDSVTTLAFINTDIAASFATITWVVIEWMHARKPKLVGLLTGSIAGLATITPCAGFVPVWAAPIIGIGAGLVCYYSVQLKNRLKWDDALDVWGVHGMGGVLGTILLGVFAAKSVNPAGTDGLVFGNYSFFFKEVISVVGTALYAFLFTYLMLYLINLVTRVRVSEAEENEGLDFSIHGERAYDEGVL
ncbi:MAG TPA: ammonium transporter [Tenuifilaceae bacterium]|nr:ammonium transporter [Tenuifilaceae bacterium]HPE17476.1 ammonium transporter [Tenuifilaceae bacterium]HPJ45153.1 ammonium transporter [Tenuifilaceae bacterium]HPQ33446.1 ammonium transporter [Tenuifilaceae bacterium]HRX67022.1 ammonium transporter [Tenuifilaceae bacterium]